MAATIRPPAVQLRPTGSEDLEFVLDLEARSDFAAFILRWPAERHRAAFEAGDQRHLVICDAAGERLGFAILAGIETGGGSIELLRIVLARPGAGVGGAALAALSAYVFGEIGADRLWLDVFEDNSRARRAYLRAGFSEDGGPRPTLQRGDEAVPLVVMSLAREAFLSGLPADGRAAP